MASESTGSRQAPPLAQVRPWSRTLHGVTVEDPYHWLKDPNYPSVSDPEILAYLEAENAYFERAMAPHSGLVDQLFDELKGRVPQDDESVPYRDGDWLYWWRFEEGRQYRSWWRKRADDPEAGDPQLLVDENREADGKQYFRLGALAVSPDGSLLAWSSDDDGSERFKLRVREIGSGEDMVEVAADSLGQPVWSADGGALAYVQVNDQWRPWRVLLHRLSRSGRATGGRDAEGARAEDVVLYEEADPSFFVHLGHTQDREHIVIATADHVTSEVRLVPSTDPLAEPLLVSPRQSGRQYEVDSANGRLFIRTNDRHVNFRVVSAGLDKPGEWEEVIAPSDRVYLRGLTAFRSYLAVSDRVDGLDGVRLRTYGSEEHHIAFPEASYTVGLGPNAEPDAPVLRVHYASMVTPDTVFDYEVAQRTLVTRKVREVPSGYDASRYRTERLTANARDGARVPISIVYPAGFPKDGTGRVHLYGYGAYGHAIPPGFSASRLSLLDRGIAFAIAHIRGGDDLGYSWYLDGKLTRRWNTFNDFVDCAKALIAEGFASAGNISISGGSAGGELMGVAANTDPELWRAVVAHVPFVDVLNTMCDDSLPLTPIEWPEWGNPLTDEAAFRLILSYSPYDNVKAQAYPPILVTGGLNDPRVTYWEPAKWVARLRATRTDDNLLLLKTNMGAGHGGKSGRFEALRETAEEYAFVAAAFGLA
jgi:oligopeptidase B